MKVGLVDTGLDPALAAAEARRFAPGGSEVTADRHGHGSAMARLIRAAAPDCALLNAQVFGDHGTTSAANVAAGLDWVVERGARLVNLSLGLVGDRTALRVACARAVARGVLLVASVPAMGPAVYPAAYAGVLRVTGDARCRPGELAWINDGRVDFGACPQAEPGIAGASAAAARVTGALAARLADSPQRDNADVIARLVASATHVGPQTEHLRAAGGGR